MKTILTLVFLLISTFAYSYNATYVRIVDGDTLIVQKESDNSIIRVRLFAINTPEKGDILYTPAKIFADSIMKDQRKVFIEKIHTDRWGRDVAIVELDNNVHNLPLNNLNYYQLHFNHAIVWDYYCNKYKKKCNKYILNR